MVVGLAASPSARTFTVEELVREVWNGQIRIPHFQRDFRWNTQDVRRLFESIVLDYPVGSLLLWNRPAKAAVLHIGALRIDAPNTDAALWVVDGQQRLTSLANALHPGGAADSRFAIAYALERREFVSGGDSSDPTVIPLPVLFDLQKLIRWFANRPEIASLLDDASAITTKIRQFPIPASVVPHADERVLQDIFDRMNNAGKRLRRAEVFSALYAGTEEASENHLTIARIGEEVDSDRAFGRIDDDTVLRAILARRGPDIMREIRIEFDRGRRRRGDFPAEGRDAAYANGQAALVRAVEFLQDDAAVPHFAFLPYRYLLVVLARFFGLHPGVGTRERQLLRRWFWRAAVHGPGIYRGSATGGMRALCARIKADDLDGSIEGLIDAVRRREQPAPDLRRFRTNTADTRIVLCEWWDRRPLSPLTGDPYDRTSLAASLGDRATAADAVQTLIHPRTLPADQRLWAANRILLLEDEAEEADTLFLARSPDSPIADVWTDVLISHHLDSQSVSLLGAGEDEPFLRIRQSLLNASMLAFVERMCEWELEDTPSLETFHLDDLPEEPWERDDDLLVDGAP